MTKRELIQAIAAKAGLTNAQAEAALDAFGAVITEALVADKKIQLPGVFTASTTQLDRKRIIEVPVVLHTGHARGRTRIRTSDVWDMAFGLLRLRRRRREFLAMSEEP